jgi:hypothetical protein
LHSKLRKNDKKSNQTNFSSQIQYRYKKKAEFHADFKSTEKVFKNVKKKLVAKT